MEKHIDWFQKTIDSQSSQLFILMLGDYQTGVLKVDNIKGSELKISIIILPSFRGKGLARKALKGIEDLTPIRTLKAIIHKNNTPSKNLFVQSGYVLSRRQSGNFLEYKKNG